MGTRSSPSFRGHLRGTEHATPATQIEPDMLKASRLSRKRPRRPWVYPFVAKLPWTSMQVLNMPQMEPDMLKVPRLSRKRPRRPWVPVRRRASADIYAATESVTPARQIEPDMLKVSRRSRKRPRRPWVPVRRQASAHIYAGTASVTPATQIEPDMLTVSRLSCNGVHGYPFVAKLPRTSTRY